MKHKKIYFVISGIFLIPGIVSLALWGLRPAVDFVGGTLLELKIEENNQFSIFNFQTDDGKVISIQKTGDKTYLLKMKPIGEEEKNKLISKLGERFGAVEELRFETVGPTLGRELLIKTLIAVVLAAGFILAYVAYQFKDKMYGVCAILAMFHDSLILLGSFSLLGHFLGVEVDTLFVTAVLTILSFSVHDTVVVYDRIRESVKMNPKADFSYLVNRAVNETLIRSLNNSLTIIFMLLALLLLGGTTIKWFALALLIGTISGTYSSTFTAAPLLIVWKEWGSKYRQYFPRRILRGRPSS